MSYQYYSTTVNLQFLQAVSHKYVALNVVCCHATRLTCEVSWNIISVSMNVKPNVILVASLSLILWVELDLSWIKQPTCFITRCVCMNVYVYISLNM